jgi:trehalose/maltose hydrolase-like predicted phosphorylase
MSGHNGQPEQGAEALPPMLCHRFEAAVFDWDGTAVPDRSADATRVRAVVEALCASGLHVGVVSGTHVGNVDGQLAARPSGPGSLFLCLNRGSEVFTVGRDGPVSVHRRIATADEDEALSAAAAATVERLAERGLRAEIISDRLNRRKIDLIPGPEWADPPKARIDELLSAVESRLSAAGLHGLADVAALAEAAARDARLGDPRVTSDVKHVEIGLTDKSDSAHWLFAQFARLGVGPHAVLLGGDEFGPIGGLPGSDSLMLVREAERASAFSVGVEPRGLPPGVLALGGGPGAFLDLLEDQLDRRTKGELPLPEPDAEWTIEVDGFDPANERVTGAILTLADGSIGTSGAPLFGHPSAFPRVLVSGVYDGKGSSSRMLEGPVWSRLDAELDPHAELRRVLDLRTGTLHEDVQLPDGTRTRSLRFAALARPGTVALRVEGPHALLRNRVGLVAPKGRAERREGSRRGRQWMQVRGTHGGVAAAIKDVHRSDVGISRLERLGSYVVGSDDAPEPRAALAALRDVEVAGFERLLGEQRGAVGEFWEAADIRIEGDPELQRAIRLALLQLAASAREDGETALGARGLTGPGYRGHVFWDADVFVLPFLAATRPRAARTLLEYRARRLPAAFREAHASGRQGARFPWESARSGRDVTPDRARAAGETIPILTGQLEEHIVADVAWGVACYLDWTADQEFEDGPGRTILVETARYWASRIRLDGDGRGHIDGVIGPDEYHENVDDNAFTNVMARWNMRRAADAVASLPGTGVDEDEVARWRSLADALVDGYDPTTGVYEQFAGFFELEPIVIADLAARRPTDAERLLGRERLGRAQVTKQADTLMLHQLVPEEVAHDSLESNLLYYEPRTAHGSSLSPGIHAGLFARAGQLNEALEWLRVTSRMDLDDLTGSSAAGLHTAAMGSLWQALVFGFAGLRPAGDGLRLDPRLPRAWGALEIRVVFRGARVKIRVENPTVTVSSDGRVPILFRDRKRRVMATPEGIRLHWADVEVA